MAKKSNRLDHHLLKISGVYYFRGAGYKFSLKTVSLKEARSLRNELCRQITLNGRISKSSFENVPKYEELVERFIKHLDRRGYRPMSIQGYKSALERSIMPILKGYCIDEIRPRHINKWMESQTCGNVTINTRLTKLKCMFDFAVAEEFIEDNPVSTIKKLKNDSKPINPFTIDEVDLFLDNVIGHWKGWFTTAFHTGMRPEEMVGLKVKFIDYDNNFIQVIECVDHLGNLHPPKTASGVRNIPMLPMVRSAMLKQTKGKQADDYVFLTKKGFRVNAANLNMRIWQKTLDKISLDRRMMYTTRHTFATMMIDSGEKLGTVASWMGHATIQEIVHTYYRFIERRKDDEGSAFMTAYRDRKEANLEQKRENVVPLLSKPDLGTADIPDLSKKNG